MKGNKKNKTNEILRLLQEQSIIRPRDLKGKNIPAEYLIRLLKKGLIKRIGRGLYTGINAEPTAMHSYSIASKRVPQGIICLLSALQFHEIGTQQPFEIWLALDNKTRFPEVKDVPLRVVRFSGKSLTEGVKEHFIEGIPVKIYNVAKTVVDCFKFRNKIGLDVALEALQDAIGNKHCTNDDIWHYAKICRVANIMRPYMESLI